MWRWSQLRYFNHINKAMFSTYVEVILKNFHKEIDWESVLHVCGGDPTQFIILAIKLACSPRMWRWSSTTCRLSQLHTVFSTYVEVILLQMLLPSLLICVLHVCGGDPQYFDGRAVYVKCSTRMWRWSLIIFSIVIAPFVFSTYVEVILLEKMLLAGEYSVLHVCGGDPLCTTWKKTRLSCSPRMWRWSW